MNDLEKRLLKATEKLINSDKQVSKKLRFHFIQQRDPELDKHLNQEADIKPSDWKSTKLVSSVADDSFLKDLPEEFQNHYNIIPSNKCFNYMKAYTSFMIEKEELF